MFFLLWKISLVFGDEAENKDLSETLELRKCSKYSLTQRFYGRTCRGGEGAVSLMAQLLIIS